MNKRTILISLAVISSYSHADDFLPINNLQRLFTNADQRIVIDKLKAMKGIPTQQKSSAQASANTNTIKTMEKGNISARGFVTKNNSFMLTWIRQNGQLKLNAVQKPQPVTDRSSNPVIHLKVKGQPLAIKIKPGQTYLRDEHIVYDDWQLGFKTLNKKSNLEKKSRQNQKSKRKQRSIK